MLFVRDAYAKSMEATVAWTEKAEAVLGGSLQLSFEDLLTFARSGTVLVVAILLRGDPINDCCCTAYRR